MIIGTAGHIDHGKTTLVRALTGVDTDRLKEEKARGISIELGYAYAPLPDGEVLGYIDVPGHERLIHTMAAGACGIDFALLVVAADDGVMPQTREHVTILTLLGVARGAVALTKVDRTDAAHRLQVRAEIDVLLAGTPFAHAPVFEIDATDDADSGVTALRAHLAAAARQCPPRQTEGLFRLAIDRVFTLAGHGTVVTGTVFAGQAQVGQTLSLAPSGRPVRVRGIHAQNRPADAACAGQRCALNLAGIDKAAIARGDWIVDPALVMATTHVDVSLSMLPDSGIRLGHWTPLHVHLGTARGLAHAVLLDGDRLDAGGTARAQLVFDTPLCALPGDRFIVRNAQATHTVGGGHVLDPFAPERRRRSPARLAYLSALQRMLDGEGVAPLLAHAERGIAVARLACLTGRPSGAWSLPPDARRLGTPTREGAAAPDACVILDTHWQAAARHIVDTLGAFHARAPDEPGPDAARLRRIAYAAPPALPDTLWHALLDTLIARGDIRRDGPWLHLPAHTVSLSDTEAVIANAVLPKLAAGRYDPPWVRDLAADQRMPEDAMRQLLRKLARQGMLHPVVRDLFYHHERIRELAALVATLADQHDGRVNAATFRDATGLGRKRAIQILEFFDRVGYTRRVGDTHRPRPGAAWPADAPQPNINDKGSRNIDVPEEGRRIR